MSPERDPQYDADRPTLADVVDSLLTDGDDDAIGVGALGEFPDLPPRIVTEHLWVTTRPVIRRTRGGFDTLTVATLPDGRLQLVTTLQPGAAAAVLGRLVDDLPLTHEGAQP